MALADFHPTVRDWFAECVGEPTAPQRRGWPLIRAGRNVLIAAPTGSGKTFAAFLSAVDELLRGGPDLPDETRVLYVSPLRALSNDIQKNLAGPLAELRARDASLPEVRVLVRTGDTPQRERQAMKRRPPHVVVTTPESLYILLGSEGGRALLSTVRLVIADEIHAVIGDKRGAHLALSLERLEELAGGVQRVGLSATQKPLAEVARFLVGTDRECELVDEGHRRELDLAVEVPPAPLETVISHETFGEIYDRIAELIGENRTTLIFVPTRKLAERAAAQLARRVGEQAVACHHSSLSKERRLDAEQRLKAGQLAALVATASLELGIDIGEIDLVVHLGTTRSIAQLLQRIGRAGHGVDRLPVGRLFPLTVDELTEAAALLLAVRRGELDRTPPPSAPLDILLQQVVAACTARTWGEDELFELARRAWPYRALERDSFDAALGLHTEGRRALLHRDGVNRRLRGTRRAPLVALLNGGAIPDRFDYRVLLEPEGIQVGSLEEDFAFEASAGDVFQLGNSSWRILKVESGTIRVADARGAPSSLPFWFGEAPARTPELSAAVSEVRERVAEPGFLEGLQGFPPAAAEQLVEHVEAGRRALGAVPTTRRLIAERFFDETGGTQLVLHAPLGSRINRAFGLALRKRFCRGFGFELQAAADEDSIVLSLGPQHSFDLEEVFDYLTPESARHVLTQAVLATPVFETRWRWNATRSLLLERQQTGKRVPGPLQRMRADDLLVQAFPDLMACGENLPPGDLPVPLEQPLVAQTIHDCLHEAMDADGLVALLEGLRSGAIERLAIDTPEPSSFARAILNAAPYAFLDDAPLEERRTQAVQTRRVLDPRTADELGALDPAAVERVREEAWPAPRDAEELHEALLWMGYVDRSEAGPWSEWLEELRAAGRAQLEGPGWFAAEATREPERVLRGRLEALGPIFSDDPLLVVLEGQGCAMRTRLEGREAWCDRRLLARIQRYTLEGLRRQIEPVSASQLLSYLAAWQHLDEERRLEGPAGVRAVVQQLAGFELPAGAWEKKVLAPRVRRYRPEWLDELGLRGELVWGRLWGEGRSAIRSTPLCLIPRAELGDWLGLARRPEAALSSRAEPIEEVLRSRGASFAAEVQRATAQLPSHFEEGLVELIGAGRLTGDAFASLRWLLTPAARRRDISHAGGRWSLFRDEELPEPSVAFVARALLRRYGVVFRALLERERQPVPWRELVRALRALELRGEVRGGRFVARFAGEQFALPEAVALLRLERNREPREPLAVSAADPLNLIGVLTPEERVPPSPRREVWLRAPG